MEKFSKTIKKKRNIKENLANQKLYNEVYNIVERTIKPSPINEKVNNMFDVLGIDVLVENILKYIENEVDKRKLNMLKKYKNDFDYFVKYQEMDDEYKNIFSIIQNTNDEAQLLVAKQLIEEFTMKWSSLKEDMQHKEEKLIELLESKIDEFLQK